MSMNNAWRQRLNASFGGCVTDIRHDKEAVVLEFHDVWIVIHKDTIRTVTNSIKRVKCLFY